MRTLHLLDAGYTAVAARTDLPATSILLDSPDARLVVFRLAPGQAVPSHRSASTVLLSVLKGSGMLSGDCDGIPTERACATGELVVYEPNELHGMRATDVELILLAVITPRPGARPAGA
jgi:quercetin dioxygenase-like cupin family protein